MSWKTDQEQGKSPWSNQNNNLNTYQHELQQKYDQALDSALNQLQSKYDKAISELAKDYENRLSGLKRQLTDLQDEYRALERKSAALLKNDSSHEQNRS